MRLKDTPQHLHRAGRQRPGAADDCAGSDLRQRAGERQLQGLVQHAGPGAIDVPWASFEVGQIVYEGLTKGFNSKDVLGIEGYGGFSMGVSFDLSLINIIQGGGTYNFPVNPNGTPAPGVSSFTWNLGASLGLSMTLLYKLWAPLEGSVSISNYAMVLNSKKDYLSNGESRILGVNNMFSDLKALPNTSGRNLALSYLTAWITNR